MTPLAPPVVPDVKTMEARSSGRTTVASERGVAFGCCLVSHRREGAPRERADGGGIKSAKEDLRSTVPSSPTTKTVSSSGSRSGILGRTFADTTANLTPALRKASSISGAFRS